MERSWLIVLFILFCYRREEAQTTSYSRVELKPRLGVWAHLSNVIVARAASQGALESAGAILKAPERGESTEIP